MFIRYCKPAYAIRAHDFNGFMDVGSLGDRRDSLGHYFANRALFRSDAIGNDLHHQVPVCNDSDCTVAIWFIVSDQKSADMMRAHESGRLLQTVRSLGGNQ